MTHGGAAVAPRQSLVPPAQQRAVLPSSALSSPTARFPFPFEPQPATLSTEQDESTRNALRVIAAYDAVTVSIEQNLLENALAAVASAVDMQHKDDGGGDDDEMVLQVDPELVRDLVQSGSADVIIAEQAAKALLRRRKHRESMIRYRRNKKMGFEEMRAEEQRLAAQLQELLHEHISGAADASAQQRQRELAGVDAAAGDMHDADDVSASTSTSTSARAARAQQTLALTASTKRDVTLDSYAQVVALKERLHHENALLRHRLADLYRFTQVMQEAHESEAADDAQARKAHAARQFEQPGGRWVRFLEHDEPFYFVPFKRDECCAIASATLEKIFTHQSGYLAGAARSATVLKLFDWTASLQFEWDDDVQLTMIRYQFKKTFRNPQRSVEQLVDDEWRIFNDDEHFVHVHRVPVYSQMLQRVDENMTVRLWNAPEPKKSLRFRNVSLFTRSRYTSPLGQDCGIVTVTGVRLKNFREQELMSLDEFCRKHLDDHDGDHDGGDDSDDDGSAVYTHGGFVYTTFVNDERGDMEVEFGGRVDITSEEQGRFLMVELGGTCVRLEHLLFPFRVLRSF